MHCPRFSSSRTISGDKVLASATKRRAKHGVGLEQEPPLRKSQEYDAPMQVAIGTVVDGKIVVEDVPLVEGAVVAVVTRGADEDFALTKEQEDELLAAMAEIERGDYVTLEDLLRSLPKQT